VPTMSRPSETQQIRDALLADDIGPSGLTVRDAWLKGDLDLDFVTTNAPLRLIGCVFEGSLSLRHAQIPALYLNGTAVRALSAEGLQTRHVEMRDGRCADALDLENARIDGSLLLEGTSTGSLYAGGLHVGRNLWAPGLFINTDLDGKVCWLDGCDIGGDLVLDDAMITNGAGGAITANGAKVGGAITTRGAILRASSDAFSLLDATAGGLNMTGAVLRSNDGSALCTDGTHFRSEVKLKEINAVSQGTDGTIRMVDTKIGAGLLITGLVRNRGGQAVSLHKTTVEASLTIQAAEIDADSDEAALEISDCDVSGELVVRPEKLVNRGDGVELDLFSTKAVRALALEVDGLAVTLNGLTYPDAPEDTKAWLTMLRDHTFRYEAQPYQQLAAVHRAAGHEHTAREVLIAQQEDLRRRGDPGNRLWHWFLGVTLGYGYKPSRAVAGLLVTFLLSIALVWTAGAYNGLSPAKDRPADACSPVNRISLAADLAIPLVKLGGTPRCELANGAAGQWATTAGWALQILGWSFATLSVAGFTGLVRKS